MNIRDAILAGQKKDRAIRRKGWGEHGFCIYHGIDNLFREHRTQNTLRPYSQIKFVFDVASLMADDWELDDSVKYQNV